MMPPIIINGAIAHATNATYQVKMKATTIPPIIEAMASIVTANISVLTLLRVCTSCASSELRIPGAF
jgi:hypothetical protein